MADILPVAAEVNCLIKQILKTDSTRNQISIMLNLYEKKLTWKET